MQIKSQPPDSEEDSVGASVLEMKKMMAIPDDTNILGKSTSSSSDIQLVNCKGRATPKFHRMQEFHQLLFYLVYGYEGKEDLNQEEAWRSMQDISNPDHLVEEYPTIYLPEISWKMFIGPLPSHCSGEGTTIKSGWCFMVDVLLRLPLCIFTEIVTINFKYSVLDNYLAHPIKKNLLLKHLPVDLRKILFYKRRHVTYVMDLCQQLCYVGLGQFGKQVMKERDQVFFYLNRKAILVDTTTSQQGYHQISTDMEYVKKYYEFDTYKDVVVYWCDMFTICMHTPLARHSSMIGKKITLESLTRKQDMIDCLISKTMEEAPAK